MSAMARARIGHMESAAEVCQVAMADLPNHPELCLQIVKSAERELSNRLAIARAMTGAPKRPWWKVWA